MYSIYCVGVGPGDPELLTVKASRIISDARQIAYFRKKNVGQSESDYTYIDIQ